MFGSPQSSPTMGHRVLPPSISQNKTWHEKNYKCNCRLILPSVELSFKFTDAVYLNFLYTPKRKLEHDPMVVRPTYRIVLFCLFASSWFYSLPYLKSSLHETTKSLLRRLYRDVSQVLILVLKLILIFMLILIVFLPCCRPVGKKFQHQIHHHHHPRHDKSTGAGL